MIQIQTTTSNDRMYMAFELSNKTWKILFSNGMFEISSYVDDIYYCMQDNMLTIR